ncbi:hypothetical protein EDC44_1339 [Cricetibacter osteomyelitidis]|uniref:Uncharacterized protein n=1 Tax=Cricetibacter osteomyelitidis TaxID=1521931 RepID=A0A4R2SRL8_9PAST|nr:hypothetical protein [Cricetibacter osteomyelitidis]TCP91251.1 hypothetical protein EDC44_1339 [Cricetibacter osteomyelitidis]
MLNLFQRPIDKDTVEALAKTLEDIGKVSLLALPVVIFWQYSVSFIIFSAFELPAFAYLAFLGAKSLRKNERK